MPVRLLCNSILVVLVVFLTQGCATSLDNGLASNSTFSTYNDIEEGDVSRFSHRELQRHYRSVVQMCSDMESDAKSALGESLETVAVIKYKRVVRLFEVRISLMREEMNRLKNRTARLEMGHEIDLVGNRLIAIRKMLNLLLVSAHG